MKEESIFLDNVGDSPRMRVMQYLIEGREFDYTITDMLNANVSWATLNELLPKLLDLGIVIETRKVGRATLYKINKENTACKHLMKLYHNLIKERIEQISRKYKVIAK